MKINTKKYAVALYEVTKGSNAEQLKSALQNFVKLLAKKGLLNQEKRLIADYKKYYNELEGIIEVEVATAYQLSEPEKKNIINQLRAVTGKKIELDCQINKELIGGIIFRINDTLLDNSLKFQLKNLKEKLVENF